MERKSSTFASLFIRNVNPLSMPIKYIHLSLIVVLCWTIKYKLIIANFMEGWYDILKGVKQKKRKFRMNIPELYIFTVKLVSIYFLISVQLALTTIY